MAHAAFGYIDDSPIWMHVDDYIRLLFEILFCPDEKDGSSSSQKKRKVPPRLPFYEWQTNQMPELAVRLLFCMPAALMHEQWRWASNRRLVSDMAFLMAPHLDIIQLEENTLVCASSLFADKSMALPLNFIWWSHSSLRGSSLIMFPSR